MVLSNWKYETRSLKSLCIDTVARHLNAYLIAFEVEENKALKYFLQLTSTNTLFSKVSGILQHKLAVRFFVNPYLEKLDLDRISVRDLDAIIVALEKQGEGISALRLVECGIHYPEATLVKLARSLPKSLKTLHLTARDCSDEVVQIIFEKCKNLQHADLHECAKVTDKGVAALLSENSEEINTALLKLNIKGTALTACGVIKILDYFPNLAELVHPQVSTAVSAIYTRTFNSNLEFKMLNLEVLKMRSEVVEACQILCPNIKSLTVQVSSQTVADICANFKKLTHLLIYGDRSISLMPLFENVGHQLVSLEAKGGICVSMDAILKFCPNLRRIQIRFKR